MHDFQYYWDFCVKSKVIILIISDPSFSLIDLRSAHLSALPGITFSERGRAADGQQMGVLPCLSVHIPAQAETVSDCQFVLTVCGFPGIPAVGLNGCTTEPSLGHRD